MNSYYRTANIKRSFQQVLGNELSVSTQKPDGTALNLDVPVDYLITWNDADGMRTPEDTPRPAWISVWWAQEMAGRGADSIVQLDCWARQQAPTGASSDPFGTIADDIADAVEDLFRGARASGALKGHVPIYDFADPSSPVETGVCLLIGGGIGKPFGCPSERRIFDRTGLNRVMLRYRIRVLHDALPTFNYAE